jgi:hypothetical protein
LWTLRDEPHEVQFYDASLVRWVTSVQVLEEWARPDCAHFSFLYYYAYAAIKQILDEPSLGFPALREAFQPTPPDLFEWSTTRTSLSQSRITATYSPTVRTVTPTPTLVDVGDVLNNGTNRTNGSYAVNNLTVINGSNAVRTTINGSANASTPLPTRVRVVAPGPLPRPYQKWNIQRFMRKLLQAAVSAENTAPSTEPEFEAIPRADLNGTDDPAHGEIASIVSSTSGVAPTSDEQNDPETYLMPPEETTAHNNTDMSANDDTTAHGKTASTASGIAPTSGSAPPEDMPTSTPPPSPRSTSLSPSLSHSKTPSLSPSRTPTSSITPTPTPPVEEQEIYPMWDLRSNRPLPPSNIAERVFELNEATNEIDHTLPLLKPAGNYTFDPRDLPAPSRMFVRYRSGENRTLFHRLTAAPNTTSRGIYYDFDAVGVQESLPNTAFGPVRWYKRRFLDVVITHVDLQADGFADLLGDWQNKSNLIQDGRGDNSRFRDFDELRHNIHALLENADDLVRQVIVVTNSKEHIPRWFKGPTKRLRFVTHAEIVTPAWDGNATHPYLPTFNSVVIESFLHRIPGLSPFFLYANNDQFVGRRLSIWDLFRPKADSRPRRFLPDDPIFRQRKRARFETIEVEPIIYGEPSLVLQPELRCSLKKKHPNETIPTLYCPTSNTYYVVQAIQLAMTMLWQKLHVFPSAHYFAHIPAVLDRRVLGAMIDAFEPDFDRSRRHRFRNEENMFVQFMYLHYSLATRSKPYLMSLYRVQSECGSRANEVLYSPQCPSRATVDFHTPIQWLVNATDPMPPLPELQVGIQGRDQDMPTAQFCRAVEEGKVCLETTHTVTSALWMNLSTTDAPHPSGLPPAYHYLMNNDVGVAALPWLPNNASLAPWLQNGAAMKLWGGITDLPNSMYLFLFIADAVEAKAAKDVIRDSRSQTGGIAFICLNDQVVEEFYNLEAMHLLIDVTTNGTDRARKEREMDRLAELTAQLMDKSEEEAIKLTQKRFYARWEAQMNHLRRLNDDLESRVRHLEERIRQLQLPPPPPPPPPPLLLLLPRRHHRRRNLHRTVRALSCPRRCPRRRRLRFGVRNTRYESPPRDNPRAAVSSAKLLEIINA